MEILIIGGIALFILFLVALAWVLKEIFGFWRDLREDLRDHHDEVKRFGPSSTKDRRMGRK